MNQIDYQFCSFTPSFNLFFLKRGKRREKIAYTFSDIWAIIDQNTNKNATILTQAKLSFAPLAI